MDVIDSILGALGRKKKDDKKKGKDYGGNKQEEGEGSNQPGSLFRKGGRARQLEEMEK